MIIQKYSIFSLKAVGYTVNINKGHKKVSEKGEKYEEKIFINDNGGSTWNFTCRMRRKPK